MKIKSFFSKVIKNKKYLVIFLIICGVLGWFLYSKFKTQNGTGYILTQVKKGEINISVSGSGFVVPKTEISLKPKASGDIVYIGVKDGQKVKRGDLILKLDTEDAEKNVRDAELALENAKLSLEKLKKQYEEAKRADSLNKYYEDGMSVISNFYNDYPSIFNGLEDILFGSDFVSSNQTNVEYYSDYDNLKFKDYPDIAERLKNEIKNLYPQAFADFNLAKRGGGEERKKAINEAYNLILKISELNKMARDLVLNLQNNLILENSIHKYKNIIDSHANSLNSYYGTLDSYLKNVLAIINNINSYNDNLSSYPLDIKNQELNVLQKQNALQDAKDKLNDYYLRAPFDGTIANFDLNIGDSVSASTEVAKLITENKIAEISLNELDTANISLGQKAKLTFDAFPGLEIWGEVSEISPVGEESNGVVSYTIKINFEDKENKIKPNMSVTAEIIINSKKDVLVLPASAIKTEVKQSYVLKIEDKSVLGGINFNNKSNNTRVSSLKTQPVKVNIETGISNNELVEIKNGLNEGDIIVVREITQTTNKTIQSSSQSPAVFRFGAPAGR